MRYINLRLTYLLTYLLLALVAACISDLQLKYEEPFTCGGTADGVTVKRRTRTVRNVATGGSSGQLDAVAATCDVIV